MRVVFLILMVISLASHARQLAGIKPLESLPGAPDAGASNDIVTKDKDPLTGGYLGIGAALTHMNTKIDQNDLSGSGGSVSFTIGGGKKVRKAYLAGELEVNYGSLLANKKTYGKVANHVDIGLSFRVGYANQNKIIPYIKAGFGWTDYKLKSSGQKEKFNAAYFAPGLGIEIPILSESLLRLEASYSMNLANKELKNHTFQSKPSRIILKAGGFTRF